MARLVVASGSMFNLGSRATVTASPTVDSLFPLANAYDGDPEVPVRFESAITTSGHVQYDIDQLDDIGGFETWAGGSPDGWTEANTGSGTVNEETVTFFSGSKAARLDVTTGGDIALIRVDKAFRSGEWVKIRLRAYGTGAEDAKYRVTNLRTGKKLTAAGAWSASDQILDTTTAAAWTLTERTFQVEGFADCRADSVSLRLEVFRPFVSSTDPVYVDGVEMVPGIDILSIHGHNLDPLMAVTMVSDDDSAFGSAVTQATLDFDVPDMYALLAARVYARYWRALLTGAQASDSGIVWAGEVVLAQGVELTKRSAQTITTTLDLPQVRPESPSGREHSIPLGAQRVAEARLPTQYTEDSEWEQARDEILERSGYGQYPVLVIVTDAQPSIVYGRVPRSLSTAYQQLSVRQAEIVVRGMPTARFS